MLVVGIVFALIVLLGLVAALGYFALRYRNRYHQLSGRAAGGPIPPTALRDFHPLFAIDELGPTPRAEVHFIGTGDGVPHGTTDKEAWVLAVLAKEARNMFEFGTATGKTAYLWARNSPPEARVTTLTLTPDLLHLYKPTPRDTAGSMRTALAESRYTRFRYTGTEVEGKITQLFGDSKDLDDTPYTNQCDLIFIDGSHAYSYVESDTAKALRMLSRDGIILWHDYKRWARREEGVFDFLNELSRTLPLVHLRGTTMVAYRRDQYAHQLLSSGT